VFESKESLENDIRGLLGACAYAVGGHYACVLDPRAVLYEYAQSGGGHWVLRQYLERRLARLFEIPPSLAAGGEMEDAFADWETPASEAPDEFLLAFINGKVAVLLACPDAEKAQGLVSRPLRALVDRLFRLNPAWRLDEKGRGLFLSRPRLDLVVVGRPGAD
jgi:hypothetical protein